MLETVSLESLGPSTKVFLNDEVGSKTTCRGLAFQILCYEDIEAVCKTVVVLTNWLKAGDIAYNLYVTRGSPFGVTGLSNDDSTPCSLPSHYTALRVFLWPRQKFVGAKSSDSKEHYFHVAACELAGHLVLNNKTTFDHLTEQSAMNVYREAALADDTWNTFLSFARSI